MKLLLTSSGLTNDSIAQALSDLVAKDANQTNVAFIPTAAYFEKGNKNWLIDDLYRIKNYGYKVDLLDILGSSKELTCRALEDSDVIFCGGGNNWYLMNSLKKSGLEQKIPDLLRNKVYAGISAGSMIASPFLKQLHARKVYEEFIPAQDIPAFNFINFYILPHLNSPIFPNGRAELLNSYVGKDKTYALDDQSAIKVNGSTIEVVSKGEWLEFN